MRRHPCLYLKSRCRSRVEVEHMAGGGWCGGVWTNGNASLRLAKSRHVEELSCALEAVSGRQHVLHDIQTHRHSLMKTHKSLYQVISMSFAQQHIFIKLHLQEELIVCVLGAEEH